MQYTLIDTHKHTIKRLLCLFFYPISIMPCLHMIHVVPCLHMIHVVRIQVVSTCIIYFFPLSPSTLYPSSAIKNVVTATLYPLVSASRTQLRTCIRLNVSVDM